VTAKAPAIPLREQNIKMMIFPSTAPGSGRVDRILPLTILYAMLLFLSPASVVAQRYDPIADKRAVVARGNVRFSVLSPQVIRMEWAEDRVFEDRASLTFINRRLPVPAFHVREHGDTLILTTGALTLTYLLGADSLSASNIAVRFHTGLMEGTWYPGMPAEGNLKGTARTLDGFDGETSTRDSSHLQLEDGILSRDGWVLVDDSHRPLFDNSDWSWVTARTSARRQDFYFIAYGHDFKSALREFTSLAGRIALPPRYAFGYWYSRWRSSSEMEFRELVSTFESLGIPLDVLVIDMDWHITSLPEFFKESKRQKDQAGEDYGWTGFSWNKSYFPDPKRFLDWTETKSLKVCLNLHPASGIQPHEQKYPEMARALGIDPATKRYVPFNIVDKKFTENYFSLLLHPMEDDGVDFWWLDWQQWSTTPIAGVNPTFYLNYVHYTDMERRKTKRPLIYHRWGGLGNHRYQIGFSGDTHISWRSLEFQPYFTATAANVGFGYWGNDIGGFYGDPNTPEQFTRWFQFGVFSPILKTHATGRNFAILRKLWEYPPETFLHLRDLVRLRYSLIPYIYTAAREAFDTGVSICRPMYHEFPSEEAAYLFRNEYMFGDDMVVHPITRPMGADSLFTLQRTWLPPGEWFETSSGARLNGGRVIERPFTIKGIPLYVRSGAIIPMQSPAGNTASVSSDSLFLAVYPGSRGTATLYEDEGNNNKFKDGECAFTRIHTVTKLGCRTIAIEPVRGRYEGMPAQRRYRLNLVNSLPPQQIRVNGKPVPYSQDGKAGSWSYDGSQLTTVVRFPSVQVHRRTIVEIEENSRADSLLAGKIGKMENLYRFSQFLADRRNFRKQSEWNDALYSSDLVIQTAQTGLRITAHPESAWQELVEFDQNWKRILEMLSELAGQNVNYKPYYDLLRTLP
jgi:alpha-glucosidase (family GH31 glycosyl hydrolase)